MAAALRAAGIGAGDTVAVMGPKTAEQVPAAAGDPGRRCVSICRSASTSPATVRSASSQTGGVQPGPDLRRRSGCRCRCPR